MKWKFEIGQKVTPNVIWAPFGTLQIEDGPWSLYVCKKGSKTTKDSKGRIKEEAVYIVCDDVYGKFFYFHEKELGLCSDGNYSQE